MYETESGLYYLQSRYYDPKIGRFINADSFVSTGQGILGNNMFAYCRNNPVSNIDPTGHCSCAMPGRLDSSFEFAAMCPCGGGAAGGGLLLPGLIDVGDEVITGIVLSVSYAYRQYTKSIKASISGLQPGNHPVTHHIIPYGDFSVRSESVKDQLHRAQEIMKDAGVNPKTNRINQLTLSATYHMSLHTDSYIMMVTTPIVALGEDPDPDEIYAILFDLRIIIAGGDQYAWGY